MTEHWFCINCREVVELDTHGRCPICESDAVVSCEASYPRQEQEVAA